MIFDRTEGKYIERKITEQLPQSKIGKVVSVTKHSSVDDKSNHEASVQLLDEPNSQPRSMPIITPRNGSVNLPNEGDFVIIDYLDSNEDYGIIRGAIHTFTERAPLAKEGMTRHDYGGLYIEAYGPLNNSDELEGEWVRLAKKSSDDQSGDDADAVIEIDDTNSNGAITRMTGKNGTVEIDDTGSKTAITINTDGDVNINADGNIVLAGGGSEVARKGDSVEVSDPDSGTLTGTITEGSDTVESG